MQENRSFDHAFGTLRGVRGFNDPRAITLPDGNPVWVQTNAAGESYSPVPPEYQGHATPPGWARCPIVDRPGRRPQRRQVRPLAASQTFRATSDFADMPLTLGYYNRDDIPFYYALADAFTVCDQHFCSSLTGTTPNRLLPVDRHDPRTANRGLARQRAERRRRLRSSEAVGQRFPSGWRTHGVSWKIYQNELSLDVGFGRRRRRLARELRRQPARVVHAVQRAVLDPASIGVTSSKRLQRCPARSKRCKAIAAHTGLAENRPSSSAKRSRPTGSELRRCHAERTHPLDARRTSTSSRRANEPARQGVHHQHRRPRLPAARRTHLSRRRHRARACESPRETCCINSARTSSSGKLPTVSWLVAPEKFSDHPGSAWYGAWYIAEVLDILTQNPEVWKKTIFILTYDENDGYFDHVPPFVAPDPRVPETGRVSTGIDAALEYVELEQDRKRKPAQRSSREPDRAGLPRADGHRLALEPRRLRLLAGVRPHVGAAVPGKVVVAQDRQERSRRPTSASGGGRSAAI